MTYNHPNLTVDVWKAGSRLTVSPCLSKYGERKDLYFEPAGFRVLRQPSPGKTLNISNASIVQSLSFIVVDDVLVQDPNIPPRNRTTKKYTSCVLAVWVVMLHGPFTVSDSVFDIVLLLHSSLSCDLKSIYYSYWQSMLGPYGQTAAKYQRPGSCRMPPLFQDIQKEENTCESVNIRLKYTIGRQVTGCGRII